MELVDLQLVVAGKGLAERIDRRGADIAEHDADGADGELVQRPPGVALRKIFGRVGDGASSRGDVHTFKIARTGRKRASNVPPPRFNGQRRAALALADWRCKPDRNVGGQRRKARL